VRSVRENVVNQNVSLVVPEHHRKLAGDEDLRRKHGGQRRWGG
jgi:hypothetical protein